MDVKINTKFREGSMLKKTVLCALFFAAFFATVKYMETDSTVAGNQWGAGLDVAHARGK